MSEVTNLSGKCLCGAIRFLVASADNEIGACHCNMCRRWGGGPYLSIDCKQDVSFSDTANLSVYSSSEWAERGFCNNCGSHLFYRVIQANQYIMPVGLFDLDKELIFDHQIFIDEKPDYYCFLNETQNLSGKEVMAMFAEQSS